ncbi:hypothetical protein SLA2020_065240 [Shorea laevis]
MSRGHLCKAEILAAKGVHQGTDVHWMGSYHLLGKWAQLRKSKCSPATGEPDIACCVINYSNLGLLA